MDIIRVKNFCKNRQKILNQTSFSLNSFLILCIILEFYFYFQKINKTPNYSFKNKFYLPFLLLYGLNDNFMETIHFYFSVIPWKTCPNKK